MRHRRGMGGVIGLICMAIIVFIGGMVFAPAIFGAQVSETNTAGTAYSEPFNSTANLTYTVMSGGTPVLYGFILIIALIVAALYMARI
jgi:hypothetical protein